MKELHDNVIEFFSEEKTATLSLHSKKYIKRIKKIAEGRSEEVEIIENHDGTICARIPVTWIKISPPRQMSDKQREVLARGTQKLKERRIKFESDLNEAYSMDNL